MLVSGLVLNLIVHEGSNKILQPHSSLIQCSIVGSFLDLTGNLVVKLDYLLVAECEVIFTP